LEVADKLRRRENTRGAIKTDNKNLKDLETEREKDGGAETFVSDHPDAILHQTKRVRLAPETTAARD